MSSDSHSVFNKLNNISVKERLNKLIEVLSAVQSLLENELILKEVAKEFSLFPKLVNLDSCFSDSLLSKSKDRSSNDCFVDEKMDQVVLVVG